MNKNAPIAQECPICGADVEVTHTLVTDETGDTSIALTITRTGGCSCEIWPEWEDDMKEDISTAFYGRAYYTRRSLLA